MTVFRSMIAGLIAMLAAMAPAFAYDGLVKKQVFELPGAFATVGGGTITNLRVGYETNGNLNAAGDNAILVPHFFSGTSHFAGRYKDDDKTRGYWVFDRQDWSLTAPHWRHGPTDSDRVQSDEHLD